MFLLMVLLNVMFSLNCPYKYPITFAFEFPLSLLHFL